jgi:hypothetical protein
VLSLLYDTRRSVYAVPNLKLINPPNGLNDKLTGTNSKSINSTPHTTKIDESLGRAAKLVPAVEDMYVFKGNWPSGFATVDGTVASGSKGKK